MGEHTDLVGVRLGVEIAAHDGWGVACRLRYELGQRLDLRLTDVALVVPPVEVYLEIEPPPYVHLDFERDLNSSVAYGRERVSPLQIGQRDRTLPNAASPAPKPDREHAVPSRPASAWTGRPSSTCSRPPAARSRRRRFGAADLRRWRVDAPPTGRNRHHTFQVATRSRVDEIGRLDASPRMPSSVVGWQETPGGRSREPDDRLRQPRVYRAQLVRPRPRSPGAQFGATARPRTSTGPTPSCAFGGLVGERGCRTRGRRRPSAGVRRYDRWGEEVNEIVHHPAGVDSKRALGERYVGGFGRDEADRGRPAPGVMLAATEAISGVPGRHRSCGLGMTSGVAGLVAAYAPPDVRDASPGLRRQLRRRRRRIDVPHRARRRLRPADGIRTARTSVTAACRDQRREVVLLQHRRRRHRDAGVPRAFRRPRGLGLYLVPKERR